ncbi:DinB family protein [Paenibacillus dokdonensis]|uniref:DinB family protein n=1 Tax=Paenibacillus dokdonensis TaxID=2567944 RepID=A0ABU6GG02_9BACL|nr:DinB family protein [Paenibacillus dokdonensis]MEC0238656.1 DinB family protein [Paenibacillus dokdonensis]
MVKYQDIIPYMDQVRAQFMQVLNSFGPEEKQLREKPDGWNVTEVVEHLGKLEGVLQYQIKQMLAKEPVLPSEPLDEKKTDVMDIVKSSGIIGAKIEAPAPTRPSGTLSYEEAIEKLNEVRSATKALIPKLAERNTDELLYPHPFGFELNASQWAHFIAIHETTHIRQLQRIREANQ